MEAYLKYTAIIHVIAGVISLITGGIALGLVKGGPNHSKVGRIYSMAMLVVFVTAVFLSSIKFIPFLFMIAFLSYYAVFAGVRILKLKKLHKGQKAKWYDWAAGIITTIAGISFIAYGAYYAFQGSTSPLVFLSIFFGLITIRGAWKSMKPFYKAPEHNSWWWFYHMDSMFGSYIAASTAFLVTLGRMTGIDSPLLWIFPSILAFTLFPRVKKKYKQKFNLIPAK
jgi:uncharacterized membrane protein